MVSAVLSRTGRSPPAALLNHALNGDIECLYSPALLDEYRASLKKPKVQPMHGLSEHEIALLLLDLVSTGVLLVPTDMQSEGPDPGDAHLWRLLRERPDAILITGDKPLQRCAPAWARVLSPRAWLDRYELP